MTTEKMEKIILIDFISILLNLKLKEKQEKLIHLKQYNIQLNLIIKIT